MENIKKRGRKKRINPLIIAEHPVAHFINMNSLSKLLINSTSLRKTSPIPERYKMDVEDLLKLIENWKKQFEKKKF